MMQVLLLNWPETNSNRMDPSDQMSTFVTTTWQQLPVSPVHKCARDAQTKRQYDDNRFMSDDSICCFRGILLF